MTMADTNPISNPGRPPATDARLLSLCARFDKVHAIHERLHIPAGQPGAVDDDGAGRIVEAWAMLRRQIAALPAATPEGFRAKARVAFVTLRDKVCIRPRVSADPLDGQNVPPAELMALECLAHMAGVAA